VMVPVLPCDTPETLAGRVLTQEHIMYPRVLERLLGHDVFFSEETTDKWT